MLRKNWVLWLLISIVGSSTAFSAPNRSFQRQQNPEVEKIYQKSLKAYKSGHYDVVVWELQNMLMLFPQNHRKSSALYLMARADYHLKKYDDANDYLNQLLKEFPHSRYRDEALFLKAAIAYAKQDKMKALNLLGKIIQASPNEKLVARSERIFYRMIQSDFSPAERLALEKEFKAPAFQPIWLLMHIRQQWNRGDYESAKKQMAEFTQKYPASPLRSEALQLQKWIAQGTVRKMKVGVVLPLTGYYREQATDLVNGIKLAFERWKQVNPRANLNLTISDSHDDMVQLLKTTQQMAHNRQVLGVVGSLESSATAALGAVAACTNLPVLAPTATANGIAGLGTNIFQMDGDIDIRGKKIAEYAVNQLHLKTFAILAPADEYGKQITDSFTETIDKLGGKILAETWYYEGAVDFKKQLSHIRNVGLEKMLWDSLQTAHPEYSEAGIDSLFAIEKRIWQEKQRSRVIKKLADSTAVPVTSIDGVFLPIYTEDIKYVAPQYALFNIQSQILGSDYWKDLNVLDDNRNYVNGVVFTTDVYANENALPYLRFTNTYRKRFKMSPSKFSLLGYDTMNFLLSAVKTGAFTRKTLLEKLKTVRRFDGIHGAFLFENGKRVNSGLVLLQYRNGHFMKLH